MTRVRRSSERPNFALLDLFSGCGGLTEGFTSVKDKWARFVPGGAVEIDESAAATYAANFGANVFQGDIADWIGGGLPSADVVIGGPPCQGFSSLGKRDPDDDRNKLWLRYAEVVASVKPLYFVLENVAPFLRSGEFEEFERKMRRGGDLADYTIEDSPLTVNASDYGAAQKRRRAVVVGRRRDLPAIRLAKPDRQRTVFDAIGDTDQIVTERDLPPLETDLKVANRRIKVPGWFSTEDLHVTRNFTELSQRRFQAIKIGGNRHDLPRELRAPCWMKAHEGSHDVMGRLHWDKPAVTIRTEFWKPEKGRYLHPEAHRPITHMEAALLQGFPLEYRWCGTKIAIGRQIGNAVPVELGRAVASAVLEALEFAGAQPRPEGDL